MRFAEARLQAWQDVTKTIDGGYAAGTAVHVYAIRQFVAYQPNSTAAPLWPSPACATLASVFLPNWKMP